MKKVTNLSGELKEVGRGVIIREILIIHLPYFVHWGSPLDGELIGGNMGICQLQQPVKILCPISEGLVWQAPDHVKRGPFGKKAPADFN